MTNYGRDASNKHLKALRHLLSQPTKTLAGQDERLQIIVRAIKALSEIVTKGEQHDRTKS